MDLIPQHDSGRKKGLTEPVRDAVVLDTSAVAVLRREDERGAEFTLRTAGRRSVVPFQVLEEVWYGIYKHGVGERRRGELQRHVSQFEVIWPNEEVVKICGKLRALPSPPHKTISQADAWIAATALYLACPLATADSDFDDIPGLEVWNV